MSAEAKTESRHTVDAVPPPSSAPLGGAEVGGARHPPGEPTHENPAAAAIRAIRPLIGELKSYASLFVTAKLDGLKLTGRNIAIYAALGVVGLLVGAGVVVTAVAMLVVGLAHGLGALLGDHSWLGEIIVSLLILGGVVLAIYLPLSKLFKASRTKTEQKYEGKRIQQRVEHGRDVSERAAGAKAKPGAPGKREKAQGVGRS